MKVQNIRADMDCTIVFPNTVCQNDQVRYNTQQSHGIGIYHHIQHEINTIHYHDKGKMIKCVIRELLKENLTEKNRPKLSHDDIHLIKVDSSNTLDLFNVCDLVVEVMH